MLLCVALAACGANSQTNDTNTTNTTESSAANSTAESLPESSEQETDAVNDNEMEQIQALDKGEDGRYFNLDYKQMGGFFASMTMDDYEYTKE